MPVTGGNSGVDCEAGIDAHTSNSQSGADRRLFAHPIDNAVMASETCDGCGRDVNIGGGRGHIWAFDDTGLEGMTLELESGREVFLCFSCIEALPEEPTVEDIEALPERTSTEQTDAVDAPAGSANRLIGGLLVGGIIGGAIGLTVGGADLWMPFGAGVGFLVGVIWNRV